MVKATKNKKPEFQKLVRPSYKTKSKSGGAWKVAYADFITAMMAFFMLLWLLNSTPSQKLKMMAEYFKPNVGLYNNSQEKGKDDNSSSANEANQDTISQKSDSMQQMNSAMDSLQEDIKQSLGGDDQDSLVEESVSFVKNPDGLAIYLNDSGRNLIFEKGTANITDYAAGMLENIAKKIRYTNMFIAIEGFTGKSIDLSVDDYGKWDLSFDRANNIRKFLMKNGLSSESFYRVTGYGDNQPLIKEENEIASSNQRRICIVLLQRGTVNIARNISNPSEGLL